MYIWCLVRAFVYIIIYTIIIYSQGAKRDRFQIAESEIKKIIIKWPAKKKGSVHVCNVSAFWISAAWIVFIDSHCVFHCRLSVVARLLSTHNSNDFDARTNTNTNTNKHTHTQKHRHGPETHRHYLVHFLAHNFFTSFTRLWMLCKSRRTFWSHFIRSFAPATAHKWRNFGWACKWPNKCTQYFFYNARWSYLCFDDDE